MDIKITEKRENQLMTRTEIAGEVGFDKATPSRMQVRQSLAAALKLPEDRIIVAHLGTTYGERKATVQAYAYKSRDELEKRESAVLKKRNAPPKKEGGKEEEQAAEKKDAATEEKKEVPQEEKPVEATKKE